MFLAMVVDGQTPTSWSERKKLETLTLSTLWVGPHWVGPWALVEFSRKRKSHKHRSFLGSFAKPDAPPSHPCSTGDCGWI